MPKISMYIFYQCIGNSKTPFWYFLLTIFMKTLTHVLKKTHEKVGLGNEHITNKCGCTTYVIYMASKGVIPHIDMQIAHHKSKGAYKSYNYSMDTQVRATKNFASEGTNYLKIVMHVMLETSIM